MRNRQLSQTHGGKGSATRAGEDSRAYREGYARIFGEKHGLSANDDEEIEGMIRDLQERKQ